MGWLIFLIILCVICLFAGWHTFAILILFFLAGIALAFCVTYFYDKWMNKKQEEAKRKEAKRKQEELVAKIPMYNFVKNGLIRKYGIPDNEIVLEEINLDKEILIFGRSNRIWLFGRDLPMSDILGCSFIDNPEVIKGQVTSSTQTNTGNMLQRAFLGGVLLGGIGAIIGGNTAKQETITHVENDRLTHDYTVIININSLSAPLVKVNLGNDTALVNEIIGLMSVIINRNNRKY